MFQAGSRHSVLRGLGEHATIWVNPKSIRHHVGKNFRSRKGKRPSWIGRRLRTFFKAEPFVIPAAEYVAPEPIEETTTFARVADLHANLADVTRSLWFRHLSEEIERNGVAWHTHRKLRSRREVADFLREYGSDLLGSMARDGYVRRTGDDLGYCFIGADEKIHKAHKGRHRLCAAKILGLERFPLVVVGMHEAFVRGRIGRELEPVRLRAAIRAVERACR